MNSEEMIEKLDKIKDMIVNEKYEEVLQYIDETRTTIKAEQDITSDYIDNLANNLK